MIGHFLCGVVVFLVWLGGSHHVDSSGVLLEIPWFRGVNERVLEGLCKV